jgi:hypothetical protein
MSDAPVHEGSCHCGQVKFQVALDLTKPAISCNCSICQRTGTMLSFVPADEFKLQAGDAVLTDYQFGKERLHHLFCSKCGVRSFVRGQMPDGTKMVAVNVRCLEGVNLDEVPVKKFDGRSR